LICAEGGEKANAYHILTNTASGLTNPLIKIFYRYKTRQQSLTSSNKLDPEAKENTKLKMQYEKIKVLARHYNCFTLNKALALLHHSILFIIRNTI